MENLLIQDLKMNAYKNETVNTAFRAERKRLFEFIKKRVPQPADAEDVLQDVFYQFTQVYDPVAPIEKIASWLYRVAKNKIIDRHRKMKPVYMSPQNDSENEEKGSFLQTLFHPDDGTDEIMTRELIWNAIEVALDELPKEQRQAFVWNELEEKSFKEISLETGIPINTLISRKRYAILYLREQLKDVYKELFNS
ncbi:MAG TPA: sigma-70 family RNA polymerase sigma factor [Cytophagaceae bacterium]|jgi:RNA polymerase sigma factor (sigma-70 family)